MSPIFNILAFKIFKNNLRRRAALALRLNRTAPPDPSVSHIHNSSGLKTPSSPLAAISPFNSPPARASGDEDSGAGAVRICDAGDAGEAFDRGGAHSELGESGELCSGEICGEDGDGCSGGCGESGGGFGLGEKSALGHGKDGDIVGAETIGEIFLGGSFRVGGLFPESAVSRVSGLTRLLARLFDGIHGLSVLVSNDTAQGRRWRDRLSLDGHGKARLQGGSSRAARKDCKWLGYGGVLA